MRKTRFLALASFALLGAGVMAGPASAHGWGVGIHIGLPLYFGGCYAPYPYPYYYYRPVYVAPPPVYVAPAPVVVQQVPPPPPAAYPPSTSSAPPATSPSSGLPPAPIPATLTSYQSDVNRNLQLLGSPDEQTRLATVAQLGRSKSSEAIDPLAATLAGDRSPSVREAAARALGLIGSPRALPALKQAALSDTDRDVRHSAGYAAEVVESSSR